MTRIVAREMVVHIVFALPFASVDELLSERLSEAFYERLQGEDEIFDVPPDGQQAAYIEQVARGVYEHAPELDGYIEKYSKGWRFGRLPRVAVAVLRTAMFEVLYLRDEIPIAAAINAAVEIAKKYEPPEVVSFINGILGSFSRQELS